jgi:hypothetical protein
MLPCVPDDKRADNVLWLNLGFLQLSKVLAQLVELLVMGLGSTLEVVQLNLAGTNALGEARFLLMQADPSRVL